MCGIFGCIGVENAAALTLQGLFCLQHRGQEGAGLAVWDGKEINFQQRLGLVAHLRSKIETSDFPGNAAIGHVRYGTIGGNRIQNVQPLVRELHGRKIALAHNGDLVNVDFNGDVFSINDLRLELNTFGSIFESTTDTELLFPLIARAGTKDIIEAIVKIADTVAGAFSLLFLWEGHLIAVKDPWDFRPLSIGQYQDGYVFSSETCAFNHLNIDYWRDVRPGEIVVVAPDGDITSTKMKRQVLNLSRCSFEFVYFARPDSKLWGQSVSDIRRKFGQQLAQEVLAADQLPLDAFVTPILDSGRMPALAFAQVLMAEQIRNIIIKNGSLSDLANTTFPYCCGMNRNQFSGRNFITPDQDRRDSEVNLKHSVDASEVFGREIIEVDDSIVRGTTTAKHVSMLKANGARRVHVAIASPRVTGPCHYGIDTKGKDQLIAASQTIEETRAIIGADSLWHLSTEGFNQCLGCPGNFCTACFTGQYPIEPAG